MKLDDLPRHWKLKQNISWQLYPESRAFLETNPNRPNIESKVSTYAKIRSLVYRLVAPVYGANRKK